MGPMSDSTYIRLGRFSTNKTMSFIIVDATLKIEQIIRHVSNSDGGCTHRILLFRVRREQFIAIRAVDEPRINGSQNGAELRNFRFEVPYGRLRPTLAAHF